MNILILYGSLEGQTEKIAEFMADSIRDRGHRADIQSGGNLPGHFSVDNYEAIIIGGSIHMGKYPAYVKKFIVANHLWLRSIPSAFFTVCMAVNSQDEKSRETAMHYSDDFLAHVNWQPDLTETFAGAVKYTQYNWLIRIIMKFISRKEGGSTDTSRDHEYTNWESVEHFVEKFMAMIDESHKQ